MAISDTRRHDSRLHARQLQFDDRTVLVIDTATLPGHVDVDIVEDTALLVADSGETTEQHEIELPDGDATAFNNNGIITIEIRQ